MLRRLRDECGVDLECVDAREEFYAKLAGVSDPETKRKIIGVTFCEVGTAQLARSHAKTRAGVWSHAFAGSPARTRGLSRRLQGPVWRDTCAPRSLCVGVCEHAGV